MLFLYQTYVFMSMNYSQLEDFLSNKFSHVIPKKCSKGLGQIFHSKHMLMAAPGGWFKLKIV